MKLLMTHKYSSELFSIEKDDIDLTECLKQIGIIQIAEYDLHCIDVVDTLTVSQICDLLVDIFGYKNKSKNLFEKHRQIINQDNVIPAFTETNEINRDIVSVQQAVLIDLFDSTNHNPYYRTNSNDYQKKTIYKAIMSFFQPRIITERINANCGCGFTLGQTGISGKGANGKLFKYK